MGGGQTSTTNSTNVTNSTPWSVAIPDLQNVLGQSSNLYNSGIAQAVYGGQRVADLTPMQQQGIGSIQDQFNADNSYGIGLTALQNIASSNGGVSYNGPQLDGNGLSSGTVGALGQLNNVQGADLGRLNGFLDTTYGDQSKINQTANSFMNGSRDIQTGGIYNGLLGYNNQASGSERNLQGVASGQYLDPTQNPYIQAAVASSNQNVGNAQKEAFAASGRYGSGNFAAATAKAINDTDTQLYANQYNQERANQLSANQMLDTQQNARVNQGTNLGNALTNLGSLNNQQILSGANLQQAQNAQQLAALNSQLQGQEFNSGIDLQKATTALGAYQQGTANAMQNEMNRTGVALNSQGQAMQAAMGIPAVDASRYAPAAQLLQAGSIGQAQNQSYLDAAQQVFNESQTNPWQALSQYAAFPTAIGSMGGTQVQQGTQQTHTSGPSIGQMLLGGLSSGIGLLGKLSDERAKENIQPVGELHDGQTVYRYNYKGDDTPQIGLLAQEVQKAEPEAVGKVVGGGGLLGVDYGKATDKAAAMAPGLLGGDAPAHGQITVMMAAKPEASKASKARKASKDPAPGAMPKAMAEAVGQAVTGLLAGAGKKAAA
jgi:hypothetical protein